MRCRFAQFLFSRWIPVDRTGLCNILGSVQGMQRKTGCKPPTFKQQLSKPSRAIAKSHSPGIGRVERGREGEREAEGGWGGISNNSECQGRRAKTKVSNDRSHHMKSLVLESLSTHTNAHLSRPYMEQISTEPSIRLHNFGPALHPGTSGKQRPTLRSKRQGSGLRLNLASGKPWKLQFSTHRVHKKPFNKAAPKGKASQKTRASHFKRARPSSHPRPGTEGFNSYGCGLQT